MLSKTYNIQNIPKKDYKYLRIIKDLLDKNGWHSVDGNASYSDKNRHSEIKTYLDGTNTIFYKHKLAKRFQNYYFINDAYFIDKHSFKKDIELLPKIINDDSVWFVKASDLLIGAGEEIDIVQFKRGDNFRDKIESILKPQFSYIIQKNIDPPMLFNGYKFDVRLIGLIVYTPTEFAAYVLDHANFKTAMRRYESQTTDKTKLMTSVGNVKRLSGEERKELKHNITSMFDKSNPYYSTIMDNTQYIQGCILKCIFNDIQNRKKQNPNDYGFIITSLDMMIDYQGRCFLIEVNAHPALYDDSSTLESAYDYKYHHGLNRIIFKDFYAIVFDSLINDKLVANDFHNWKITNYYRFASDVKCRDGIISSCGDMGLYKFSLLTNDIYRYYHFILKQPPIHGDSWRTGLMTLSRAASLIGMNYSKERLELAVTVDKRIIGIIGIFKRTSKYAKHYIDEHFTHIIIDSKTSGKGYGTKAMNLLIDYVTKHTNITKLYASIYKDNTASVKLHTKVGYKNLGVHDNYKGRDIIIMELKIR